ncbi:MAG: hypothetical protein CVU43_09660 [Chloroflexi bacterium HGW-Chloroflexi-5]|jgi:hypothetical protein|nr:MAG: hypothetical protein CVU43_09660 [Chloroflexi bacterium HGW-Chloroflexi-5]
MEITGSSKLLDVLQTYPELEEQLINIAPPFKNLQNPVLRRTVGSLVNLDKVAQIGGMDATRLVNTLRRHVGQSELLEASEQIKKVEIPRTTEDPDWISGEPQFVVNGTQLLQQGEVPLGKVNQLLTQLSPNRYLLLLTNFSPTPIMDAVQKQNMRVFSKVNPQKADEFLTFIG